MANKKEFKAGIYAVIVGVILAVVLAVLTVFAFTTRYTAFSPEKVAQTYVDTIIQTGDGYNAYKNTLVAENQKLKYGDFIRRAYMVAYVNDGEEVKQADFVGTGSKEEQAAIDEVYARMYDYYVDLLRTYGMDNYDAVFTNYFEKLVEVRHEVYGDDYMDMDYMFGAFESNVQSYADYLTGTQRTFASDNKTILKEENIGAYQAMFGDIEDVEVDALVDGKKQTVTEQQPVYKLTTTIKDCTELSADEVKAYVEKYEGRITPVAESGKEKAAAFGLDEDEANDMISAFEGLNHASEIDSVAKVTAEVTEQNGKHVATQELFVVKIGNSWYVDNTNVNTSGLYLSL